MIDRDTTEATGVVVDAGRSQRLRAGQPVFFTSWDIGFSGGVARSPGLAIRAEWISSASAGFCR